MLEHGGNLSMAARRYALPAEHWLDLSTGINPHGWLGAPPPQASWRRLPTDQDELIEAAAAYYSVPHLLAVPGTQVAIQTLPRLRAPCRVGVVAPGYAEHAHRWRQAGHTVSAISATDLIGAAQDCDVLVICNPNNPTGACCAPVQLLDAYAHLAARGGWLLVDEAFVDATPDLSLAAACGREGLIVLRSFGKFFGLAGARVGFVLAWPALLEALAEWMGPWVITGPSRHLAERALRDTAWQTAMRLQLQQMSARLAALLTARGLKPDGGCALFQWLATPHALAIHEALAQCGIFTRLFAQPASLRVGLPGIESEWARLDTALAKLRDAEIAA